MRRKMARLICALLAFALLLPPPASAQEAVGGAALARIQISNIALGTGEDMTTFEPVLTLVMGEDRAADRSLMQLLLTVREMTALNVVAAREEGLAKLYVEKVPTYITLPFAQLEEALLGDAEMAASPALDAFFARLAEPGTAQALAQAFIAALEARHADWFTGEARREQDGVCAFVREYAFSLRTAREVAALLDFLCFEVDEGLEAAAREVLAQMRVATFEALLARHRLDVSLTGTAYAGAAGTIFGFQWQAEIRGPHTGGDIRLTMSLQSTGLGGPREHLRLALGLTDPREPAHEAAALQISSERSQEGDAQSGRLELDLTIREYGETYGLEFSALARADAAHCAAQLVLIAFVDDYAVRAEAGFEGARRQADGATTYEGALRLMLADDLAPRPHLVTADVLATTGPMPVGPLLGTDRQGVNPLELDAAAQAALGAEFEAALMAALGVLMQDPAIAALFLEGGSA